MGIFRIELGMARYQSGMYWHVLTHISIAVVGFHLGDGGRGLLARPAPEVSRYTLKLDVSHHLAADAEDFSHRRVSRHSLCLH